MYYAGDTIKLYINIADFTGTPADPDELVLTIYDAKRGVIIAHPINELIRTGTGAYEFYYPTPKQDGVFYYEFAGKISGLPIEQRAMIATSWV